MKHLYKLVVYYAGTVEQIVYTEDFREAKKIYAISFDGNRAVRVWIDGKRLTYSESNSKFGTGSEGLF